MINRLKKKVNKEQSKLKIAIALGFGLIAVFGGFLDLLNIPLSDERSLDITIVFAMFASLIGGYTIATPLAIIWASASFMNLGSMAPPFFVLILEKFSFTMGAVLFYQLAKKLHRRSPYNVYRAAIAAILLKSLLILPFDYYYGQSEWVILRGQQLIIEIALCCLFMSLLIKHLRQIHILNGVRKKQKGEIKDGNTKIVPRQQPSE